MNADVVVIGGGLAGLVTTLELLERGRDVLLIDRCKPEEVGGLAREAFGGMFMVDTAEQRRSGIEDSHDLALADWMRMADFDEADELPRRWAEEYVKRSRDEVGGWLRGHGVKFFPVVNWAERGVYGDGNSVPRFHLTWGCGKALVTEIWGSIEEHPRRAALDVRFGTRVTGLVEQDDVAAVLEQLERGDEAGDAGADDDDRHDSDIPGWTGTSTRFGPSEAIAVFSASASSSREDTLCASTP